MRFQIDDEVRMAKSDPHYEDEEWKIIKDKVGTVISLYDYKIIVDFLCDSNYEYVFEEHELKLYRRASWDFE